jgi:hypothetical protein
MAIHLRNKISAKTGVRLHASVTFDHPSPKALAGYLVSLLLPEEPNGRSEDQVLAVRNALSSIPPEELRTAGLLEPLLRLARARGTAHGTRSVMDPSTVDTMAAEDLIRLVTSNTRS